MQEDNRICDFTVEISNSSDTEFKGPIEFEDSLTVDGAIFGATSIVTPPDAPWTCSKVGLGWIRQQMRFWRPSHGLGRERPPRFGPWARHRRGRRGQKLCHAQRRRAAVVIDPDRRGPQARAGKNPAATQCSDAGGGCDFVVSITNPGPGAFTQPIEFSDVLTTVDGKPLPDADFGSPGPPFRPAPACRCPAEKTAGTLDCSTHALPVNLPPNLPVTIQLPSIEHPSPGGAGGATAIKNCATLAGSNEPQCVTMPLRNGALIRAFKSTAAIPACRIASSASPSRISATRSPPGLSRSMTSSPLRASSATSRRSTATSIATARAQRSSAPRRKASSNRRTRPRPRGGQRDADGAGIHELRQCQAG